MSDYQAVYDATFLALRRVDLTGPVAEQVQLAFSHAGHVAGMAAEAALTAAYEAGRPAVIWRPRIFIDGGQWCALYGDNVQDGVAGFGASPAEAMSAFDAAWVAPLPAGGER